MNELNRRRSQRKEAVRIREQRKNKRSVTKMEMDIDQEESKDDGFPQFEIT